LAQGYVSAKRPAYYFKFFARSGQELSIHVEGRGLKTGAGIPILAPDGKSDAVDMDVPYRLPLSGSYTIRILANLMSDGPFGAFRLRVAIK
jgi:hypothetical protein